ncbi:MAG: hypothetical protein JWO56_2021 [Acidobacteria bacterium]|nr:hypothetical protein [Acidobacteriota bacterium]
MGAPLIAQTPPAIVDAPFWSRRDAVLTDNDGQQVRLEIRDRSNYTLKTFTSQGKWISTYHFTPHTDHVDRAKPNMSEPSRLLGTVWSGAAEPAP